MPARDDLIARELAKLVASAEADQHVRALAQERERARIALQKALTPLIGFSGPDDAREWERTYATLVVDAVQAVSAYSGWKTLRALKLPPKPGFAIAHELFRLAYSGWSAAKLAVKVREVLDHLREARSWEGRIALNEYYDWLWKHLYEMDPLLARTPGRSSPIPAVAPERFRSGYWEVRGMRASEELTAEKVVALYGLGGLAPALFLKSPRYVQPSGKPLTAWRLPHTGDRRRPRDKATKKFLRARCWTAEQVRKAMEGLAERLGIDLTRAPEPF